MNPLTLDEIVQAINGQPLQPTRSCRISGVSIDSRTVRPGDGYFAIVGRRLDGHDYVTEALAKGALFAVVSKATDSRPDPARLITVRDTTRALGQLAAYYRSQIPATVIGVTGSNGKTTTKAMIAHLLSETRQVQAGIKSFNNHIGVPLTLLSADFADDFLVVEIGTSAPGEIAELAAMARPDIGVVTSVGPAHLEGLGGVDGVISEKLSLLEHLSHHGVGVVNIDDAGIRARLESAPRSDLITFGSHPDADLRLSAVRTDGTTLACTINDRFALPLKIPGRHNALNALAAYAVGLRVGLPREDIARRLAGFTLPEMRLQQQPIGSMLVINDCYNANPASMRAALEVLQDFPAAGRRVAVIGDMYELGHRALDLHIELGERVAASDIDVLISIGQFAEAVCRAAGRGPTGTRTAHAFESVEALGERWPELLEPQDTILIKGSRALRLERLLSDLRPTAAHA